MTANEEKVEAAALIQSIVQTTMHNFLLQGLGPQNSAFCLGVCFSGVLALFQKHNPTKSLEELEKVIKGAFLQGCKATVIPIEGNPPQ